MHCKVCNTRIAPGSSACPHCGGEVSGGGGYMKPTSPGTLPSADLSTAHEVELELNDVTAEPRPAAKARPTRPRPKQRRPPSHEKPVKRKLSTAAPLFTPDASSLRVLLAEHPDMLEIGLGVFRNDEGVEVGAGYSTAVGEIDLLGTDRNGDLVVVMISEKSEPEGEDLVSAVLQRLGWVRKHLADGQCKVRGIVLCVEVPENFSYAAAAVLDTVAFKTYRVALTFEDLEV